METAKITHLGYMIIQCKKILFLFNFIKGVVILRSVGSKIHFKVRWI